MATYEVFGVIEFNWRNVVSADSPEEAEELAESYAQDGRGLETPTGEIETNECREIEQTERPEGQD